MNEKTPSLASVERESAFLLRKARAFEATARIAAKSELLVRGVIGASGIYLSHDAIAQLSDQFQLRPGVIVLATAVTGVVLWAIASVVTENVVQELGNQATFARLHADDAINTNTDNQDNDK